MNTDPIADLLTRIRNAQNANHTEVSVPYSQIKENILKVMKRYGFILGYKQEDVEGSKVKKNIIVSLDEDGRKLTLKRISSPGQKIYSKKQDLKLIKSGLGIRILSTPKGVLSNVEANKENVGGEILCEIY